MIDPWWYPLIQKICRNNSSRKISLTLAQAVNININTVIYKGRNNYICQNRLENLINNHAHLLKIHEYEAMLTLIVWEWQTKTGDINECNGFQLNKYKRLWSMVRSESSFCSANRCWKNKGCYLGNLRNRVKNADIIIVNHSLFANELQRSNTCLPDDFIYVIDEAHHFADAIRSQLIQEFGIHTLKDVFQYFNYDEKNWKVLILKKHPRINAIYEQLTLESVRINRELRAFFDSYYNCRSKDVGKTEYYIDKHLYRNSQEEFIDISPNPWDILILIQSFYNNFQNFKSIIMECNEQFPKAILIELDMVEGSLLGSLGKFSGGFGY